MSRARARVIIFIVEGITDKTALEGILTELYEEKNIIFEIIDGDITSRYEIKAQNIKANIGNKVKAIIEKSKILPTDIEEIIHVVDMDGVYIEDEKVVCGKNLVYCENQIKTNEKNKIIERNQMKSKILNIINTMNEITVKKIKIKYRVYYMSCNLDHVLYNKQNALNEEKTILARNFEDKYIEEPEKFKEYMCNSSFSVKEEYKESWEFIKKGTNSLKRYSNFCLFLMNE